ncbi:MAG TPA: helix-turn-helix domain-containing protein [Solirubrobacteraceae bacterium]|nr:helix-turn-helix domain-containing protein [Solirubrobacteraceae bacterium]
MAIEDGAGLPEVVRTAARAISCSLMLSDAAGAVLAVAARSPADQQSLTKGASGVETHALRIAGTHVGKLRLRPHANAPPVAVQHLLATLLAGELERVRAPARASEEESAALVQALLDHELADPADLVARAGELGADLAAGGSVLVVRAHPVAPASDDWRARMLAAAQRAGIAAVPGTLTALVERDQRPPIGGEEVVLIVPGGDEDTALRVAEGVQRELSSTLEGFSFVLGRSDVATEPGQLLRAANEALLAANVAEGDGTRSVLSFAETGTYQLLLPNMSDDPGLLQRFYSETIEPLVAYDEQYATELVHTLESFLESDGNFAGTAQKLFTHRHTIRYRLGRVKELTDLDVGSSEGRERLSMGLKAMRVLGFHAPGGPATESGAGGGRVPREPLDRR